MRTIFLQHREMLKPFMDEAVKLVQEWFKRKFKVVCGIIAGLHGQVYRLEDAKK
jgi:hypothetical protein